MRKSMVIEKTSPLNLSEQEPTTVDKVVLAAVIIFTPGKR